MPDYSKRLKLDELQMIVERLDEEVSKIPSFLKDSRWLICKKCGVATIHISDRVFNPIVLKKVQVCTVCGTKWIEVTTTEEYKD